MVMETKRLILRPWQESDARDLYAFAKDPRVGPVAGWPPHTSVENSLEIIRDVLSAPHIYAMVLKEAGRTVGSIGLMCGEKSNLSIAPDEGEVGYWIGVPYWGRGLTPEALRAVLRHGFEDLKLRTLWCGYFEGNEQSRRVQEKCGFRYHHTEKDIAWTLMQDVRTEHVTCLTEAAWRAEAPL